jgi:hypothetical protein
MNPFEDFLKDPSKLSVAVLLMVALTVIVRGFLKGWIVPGWVHAKDIEDRDRQIAQLTKERDEFKSMVLRTLEIVERTQRVRGEIFDTPKV